MHALKLAFIGGCSWSVKGVAVLLVILLNHPSRVQIRNIFRYEQPQCSALIL